MRPTLAVALLAAAAATPLLAQQPVNTNLERMTNATYSRRHDFDLIHQRIGVRDINWDSTSFVGQVVTTVVSRRAGLDSIVLDAGEGLKIRSAKSASGAELRTSRMRDTLVVHLPKAAANGDTVRFTIDYDARIRSGAGLTFIGERPHTPRQLWSQGEDMNNHDWFPTYDFPNDKMTWDVDATVPAGNVAVSNGALTGVTPGANGERTFHWSQAKPSATYLVSLIVEPLAEIKDTWHDVPVDYYVYHADSALAWRLFHVTPDMIDVYSRLTGIPYPWQKYAQTTVADFFGGMENVSATTLVDWLPDSRAYADRPWYQYILIPHELAHQWFGDYVTTENWANTWLNEGFAEFMPGQYWKEKLGAHAEQDYYADEYHQYLGIDARRPMPLASMGSNNIYPKGALVLEMLEDYLGPQRFWAAVHHYLTQHAFSVATTADLEKSFEESTGEKLDWFWREWMYSAGYPSFTVTSKYDAASHTLTLVAEQTQRDSLTADSTGMRYVVPDVFTMPVTVRVGTAAGDVVKKAQIAQRVDTIVVDGVTSEPTMVVFDDGNQHSQGAHLRPADGVAGESVEAGFQLVESRMGADTAREASERRGGGRRGRRCSGQRRLRVHARAGGERTRRVSARGRDAGADESDERHVRAGTRRGGDGARHRRRLGGDHARAECVGARHELLGSGVGTVDTHSRRQRGSAVADRAGARDAVVPGRNSKCRTVRDRARRTTRR